LFDQILALPFILQGICMVVDEFYFHEKRGLARWESLGHPLDSLTVFVSLGFLLMAKPIEGNAAIFLGLSIFSCLFITKDEWVHRTECTGLENWLHAVLFVLHPIIFLCAGLLWWRGETFLLQVQVAIVGVFMLYQLLRWNISWAK
jgi:hypothetical protein